MAFPIIPKRRSGATGNPSTLELGELATNTQTGELFLGGDGGVMLLNPPTAAGTTVTEHTGDGTTTAFTFSGYNGTDDGAYIVSVGGIDQPPSKYSVSATAGGTITFVEAPVAGELISIRAIVASGAGGGGITELTGDVTASGTGSVVATLASVTTAQSNVGSATAIPVLSVDEKGRVTALSTTTFAALTTAQIAGLATTAPAALATSGFVGLSTFAARADHQHEFPTASQVGALSATAAAGGDLTGTFPNPTLAAITTAQSNIGSSTVVPVLSVDDKGRVTSLTTAQISGGSGGGITALTGDVIASGTGSVQATLAAITTAQSNVGSATQIPILSIDAKGRVTALSSVAAPFSYSASALIVAGGGGGTGAGGGAGGMVSTSLTLTSGQVTTVIVGAGGAGVANYGATGNNGSDSSVSMSGVTITAIGGGAGGAGNISGSGTVGQNGGSGGGGGANGTANSVSIAGGSGTVGQGSSGGATPGLSAAPCGGGGGAGSVGFPGTNLTGGAGGNGSQSSITGTLVYYAGGGGGSRGAGTQGAGGTGGGGAGVIGPTGANNGTVNTGGGGGGANSSGGVGGSGGSGVVILSLLTSNYTGIVTGSPTVTTSGSNTILKFTSSGTYTA